MVLAGVEKTVHSTLSPLQDLQLSHGGAGWHRQVRRVARGENGEMPAVPITVRQLEAIVRISESLARMQLQDVATEAHVRQAIELFKTATMDAVKSGARANASATFLGPGLWHVR